MHGLLDRFHVRVALPLIFFKIQKAKGNILEYNRKLRGNEHSVIVGNWNQLYWEHRVWKLKSTRLLKSKSFYGFIITNTKAYCVDFDDSKFYGPSSQKNKNSLVLGTEARFVDSMLLFILFYSIGYFPLFIGQFLNLVIPND